MNAAAEQKYDFDVVRWFAVMAAVYLHALPIRYPTYSSVMPIWIILAASSGYYVHVLVTTRHAGSLVLRVWRDILKVFCKAFYGIVSKTMAQALKSTSSMVTA